MEAWYPTAAAAGDNTYVAFFEDDTEVSSLWYIWANNAITAYAGKDSKLMGISLYRPIHDELTGKSMLFDTSGDPYLFQQPCSWGAVYFPGPWLAFRDWFVRQTKDPLIRISGVPSVGSNAWSQKSSWKKYLLKYMWEKGYFMVYPNTPDNTVLSTNHLMKGVHHTPMRKKFELPLLEQSQYEESMRDDGVDLLRAPELSKLKVFDLAVRSQERLQDIHGYDVET